MPRDTVAERRHQHELRRKAVRKNGLLAKGGSGKHKHGRRGSDELPPPGSSRRPVREPRGPKKFKFKRDVLKKYTVEA